MTFRVRILSAILPLVLLGCANADKNNPDRYRVTADMTAASAASLLIGHIDTGFLYFGNTSIQIISVDGKRLLGPYDLPLLLTPDTHTIFFRAFRDPVAAYACMHVAFEKGTTYIVRTAKPEMDKTEMWIEDDATGQIVGQKYEATMYREPQNVGVLVQAILAHPPVVCQ